MRSALYPAWRVRGARARALAIMWLVIRGSILGGDEMLEGLGASMGHLVGAGCIQVGIFGAL